MQRDGSQPTELTPGDLDSVLTLWTRESPRSLVIDQRFKTWKRQFSLFTDKNGIWRCGGRLTNATLPYSTKHPILLCKDHPLTALIVHKAHLRVMHDGVKETLTELRTQYWIVKGRSFVRKIIHQCTTCRSYEGKPYSGPPPPPLPPFRVKEAPPFTHTGVDFAGPIFVKDIVSGENKKVWLCRLVVLYVQCTWMLYQI